MNKIRSLLCLLGLWTCLVTSAIAVEAIIGGDLARHDQFPYQIALLDPNVGFICGGGIIEDLFIITVAHCIMKPDGHFYGSPISVLAGTNSLDKTGKPAQTVAVQKIYVPKEYRPWIVGTSADIALLKLKHPLKLSDHVKKLQLPSKNVRETYAGETATIAGFGWEKIRIENDETIPITRNTELRYAEADILASDHQLKVPKISEKHMFARIKQRHSEQRSVCTGDSGGPLVHNHIFVGALSLSPKECSEKEKPAIYTRVSHYLDFIYDAIHDQTNESIRTHTLIP